VLIAGHELLRFELLGISDDAQIRVDHPIKPIKEKKR
jgi:hypothetical protein